MRVHSFVNFFLQTKIYTIRVAGVQSTYLTGSAPNMNIIYFPIHLYLPKANLNFTLVFGTACHISSCF